MSPIARSTSSSRRTFLRLAVAGATGAAIFAACAPAAPPTATSAPAKPAEPTKPAAADPTKPAAAAAPTEAPKPAASAAPAKTVELSMAFTWEAAFQPTQEAFNDAFQKRHSDVKIKSVYNTWADHNKIVPTWAASNTLPDVIYIHGSRIQPWTRLGMHRALDSYLQAQKDFNLEDFFKIAIDLYARDGRRYALPYDHGPIIMAYNVDLLDAAGVKPPDENTTMDQLREMVLKLNKPGQSWGIDRLINGGNENFLARIGPFGGKVMDDDETKTLFTTAEGATGVDFWANLLLKDKAAPSPSESQAIQGGPWLAGKVALYPAASWDTPTFAKFAKFKWDVAPWPKGSAGQKTGAFGSGFGITRDSRAPDQSWVYLSEYLNKDGMEFMWGKTGRGSPARKSAYQSFLDSADAPKHAKFFADAMSSYAETGHPFKNDNAAQVLDIFNRELDLVLRGNKPTKEALATMQKESDPLLAEGK